MPHLLAVLLQSVSPLPESNVRTVLSPRAYIEAAVEAGWVHVCSETFTPAAELEDGKWETGLARMAVKESKVGQGLMRLGEERSAESVRLESLRAHSHALESSIASLGGVERVECMDVWTAVFRPARQ